MSAKGNIQENIAINEPKFNEKNITKYNKLYFLLRTQSLTNKLP